MYSIRNFVKKIFDTSSKNSQLCPQLVDLVWEQCGRHDDNDDNDDDDDDGGDGDGDDDD